MTERKGDKKFCKKCEKRGEESAFEVCGVCDEQFCPACISRSQDTDTSSNCYKCRKWVCKKHAVQVFCDCKFTPFCAHFMCEHGDVFCDECVGARAFNQSTLIPWSAFDKALRRKEDEKYKLKSEIADLRYQLERQESTHKIHMDVYHPKESSAKKRKNAVDT